MIPKLPEKEHVLNEFKGICSKLDTDPEQMKDLVIYELTDGTRTCSSLNGSDAYVDGGAFILRMAHLLNAVGARNFYVLTTGRNHKIRDNYMEIMDALLKEVDIYTEFASQQNICLRFVGDLEGISHPKAGEFREQLKALEKQTSTNTGMTLFVLIDYDTEWALSSEEFKGLPGANVIVKHTKGQVNEGLWLPGKLHGNSFVYAQNASSGRNWSDRDLLHLIAASLRSMILHKGLQYGKSYQEGEAEEIQNKREKDLSLVHRQLENPFTKRVVMFSHLGPEIYEF
ncbi:MAG: hypothetical protein ISS93_02160 [Candidatus Aenigmarchaeota archaeon]|nr:hypothetical protein [Candidatus Aenigmarchaeota archaeon]